MKTEVSIMQDYGKQKLLEYADSLRELADSFQSIISFDSRENEDKLKQMEQVEQNHIFAKQIKDLSNVIDTIAKEKRRVEPLSEKRYKQIAKELRGEGIYMRDFVFVYGEDYRQCSMEVRAKRSGITIDDLAGFMSVLLNIRLQPQRNNDFFISGDWQNYILVEEPPYHILTGLAKATKQGETISGDSCQCFEYGEGQMAILLSDGVGAGEDAYESSITVVEMMQRLLTAGFSVESSAQMINGFLMTDGTKQSTLDFCNIDLYRGTCRFCKVGAAPSFLKRDHLVEQLSSRNLPLGLLEDVEAESASRMLLDGDYIIMLSDGVLDALHNGLGESALSEIVSKFRARNPNELANDILSFVLHQCKGQINDDMTVAAIGFWERAR